MKMENLFRLFIKLGQSSRIQSPNLVLIQYLANIERVKRSENVSCLLESLKFFFSFHMHSELKKFQKFECT